MINYTAFALYQRNYFSGFAHLYSPRTDMEHYGNYLTINSTSIRRVPGNNRHGFAAGCEAVAPPHR
jgi:hypothetical protein